MSYYIAAIDVHKKVHVVAIADIATEGEYSFEHRRFGACPQDLVEMAEWMMSHQVEEIVMESTAQYWRPVWGALEQYWQPKMRERPGAGPCAGKLHLAQAKSNKGAKGRKSDYADCRRMIKRLVAGELSLSYVPDVEQRLWRTITRERTQLTRQRTRWRNQLEPFLEQGHIKLANLVSDLLGVSAIRMLRAIAKGTCDPAEIAALADTGLEATAAELQDALGACRTLAPVYRRLLGLKLQELDLVDAHIAQLEQEAATLMAAHQESIQRVAEVPGFGVDSALQMIAEVGPKAAAFASASNLASWIGVCPGDNESAGKQRSTASPKGNKQMRTLLNQAAQAAVKKKGCIFQLIFQRLVTKMDYKKAIWAIAHRLCRMLWMILHNGVRYKDSDTTSTTAFSAVAPPASSAVSADSAMTLHSRFRTPLSRTERGRFSTQSPSGGRVGTEESVPSGWEVR